MEAGTRKRIAQARGRQATRPSTDAPLGGLDLRAMDPKGPGTLARPTRGVPGRWGPRPAGRPDVYRGYRKDRELLYTYDGIRTMPDVVYFNQTAMRLDQDLRVAVDALYAMVGVREDPIVHLDQGEEDLPGGFEALECLDHVRARLDKGPDGPLRQARALEARGLARIYRGPVGLRCDLTPLVLEAARLDPLPGGGLSLPTPGLRRGRPRDVRNVGG